MATVARPADPHGAEEQSLRSNAATGSAHWKALTPTSCGSPPPDPLRLRNRDQLTEVVNAIVRDDAPIDDAPVRALAAPLVAPEDLEDFIAMAISELSGLHEGNLARYRLRPSEFRRWRGRRHEPPPA